MATEQNDSLLVLDERIRSLRQQTQGLRGAVLEKAHPEKYAALCAELDAAMREHYLFLYGDSISMP